MIYIEREAEREWSPVDSLHREPVTRKIFPFDDVIMPFKTFIETGVLPIIVYFIINIFLYKYINQTSMCLICLVIAAV